MTTIMGIGGEVLFEDGGITLVRGDANEVIPSFREVFDFAIFDPPRLAPYHESVVELAKVVLDYTEGWICHTVGGKQRAFWDLPMVNQKMPKAFLPKFSDNEFLAMVSTAGFTQGEIGAPQLGDIEPYEPPDWCPVARHPELYRWLYSFMVPVTDGFVLDPCCGSGNSLKVAREEGIRAVGIERNKTRAVKIAEMLSGG